MNKLIILFAFTVLILSACNQAAKTRQVPANISEAFVKLHPNATILKWNDEPPIWEAKYKDGEEKGAVSFNDKAEVTETELVIAESQLPNASAIPDYIKAHYPNEKIQGCEKITKQDGSNTYEIQITGKEIVFDGEGKYLSEEKD
ncbi:putative PepSY-like beta-lactamase-inhibitor [Lacibacter cauensis]|uniref:Putative PepSY-like beta-lactamase-inhibitor n=1 Tax=Lacibacter cauensis TaxID=510947 RepID=A0A562SJ64_9BACT|nr:PepSY-like domain-containing protein [Lacibacter cauensis]TWI81133.1 putative PepSY-like beta-lactamase-inhibitor [Lacibacter cauensis]